MKKRALKTERTKTFEKKRLWDTEIEQNEDVYVFVFDVYFLLSFFLIKKASPKNKLFCNYNVFLFIRKIKYALILYKNRNSNPINILLRGRMCNNQNYCYNVAWKSGE